MKQLTKCPCCKLPMLADVPVVDLNTNTVAYADTTLHLDNTQTELLHIIVQTYPGTAKLADIAKGVWGKFALTEDVVQNIRTQISEARRNFRAIGLPFYIAVVRGVGYRLERTDASAGI